MNCECGVLPREILRARVDDHILVAEIERDADARVRIAPQAIWQIVRVNPKRRERAERIVQRGLPAFLLPQCFDVRVLNRQAIAGRQISDKRIMPQFVARFKDRRDDGVRRAKREERGENDRQPAMSCSGRQHFGVHVYSIIPIGLFTMLSDSDWPSIASRCIVMSSYNPISNLYSSGSTSGSIGIIRPSGTRSFVNHAWVGKPSWRGGLSVLATISPPCQYANKHQSKIQYSN
jgi:hypothetical protein